MLLLRPSAPADIDFFFRMQQDPEAVRMAAFTSANLADRAVFETRWRRVLSDATVAVRTVLVEEEVVGQVLRYATDQRLEVSYWIDRTHWGRGYATSALRLLLQELPQRPVFARVAHDNVGSLAVLQHVGFVVVGEDEALAAGRGEVVQELVLRLGR